MNKSNSTVIVPLKSNSTAVVTSTNPRRRNRRRNRMVVAAVPSAVAVPVVPAPPSARTLKNRRRRQRRRQNQILSTPGLGRVPYYNRYISGLDPTMMDSVHKIIQTQFYPDRGLHRGLSSGFDMSAITLYQGSFDVATTATNNVISFSCIPMHLRADATGKPGFININVGTTILPPSTATGIAIPGPFSTTNPSARWRVVSFSLIINPSTSLLNRGGAGALGYFPTYRSINWDRDSIDNLAIQKPWDGVAKTIMHWSPNDNEYEMEASPSVALQDNSGLLGYLGTPLGTIETFRFQYRVGIEYDPTPAYRPFVDRKAPEVRPDCLYFINALIREHWEVLMIDEYDNFLERLRLNDSLLGGPSGFQTLNHSGFGGVGFDNPALADIREDFAEDDLYETKSFAKTIAQAACGTIEGITGEDFCGAPMRSIGKMTNRVARNVLAQQAGHVMLGQ